MHILRSILAVGYFLCPLKVSANFVYGQNTCTTKLGISNNRSDYLENSMT